MARVGMGRMRIRSDSVLTFDRKTGFYYMNRKAVTVTPLQSQISSYAALMRTFSTGAAVILEVAGEDFGKATAKDTIGVFKDKDSGALIKKIYSGVSRWGYGRYELVSLTMKEKFEIKFRQYPPPKILADASLEPISHFLKGLWRGQLTEFTGKKLKAKTLKVNKEEGFLEFHIIQE